MSTMLALIATILSVVFHSLITYWAWNFVAPTLFTGLPAVWIHLSFMQVFALIWLIRVASMILRSPIDAVKMKVKKVETST